MKFLVLILFTGFSICTYSQNFELPNLRFDYDEYEQGIDAKTMEIHHSKHHQGYVNKLNKAVEGTPLAQKSLVDLMMYASYRSKAVRNNSGGHYNHTLFWEILTPTTEESQPGEIENAFLRKINAQFGSIESLRKELNNLISMFAHNFLGTLQCIRSNAEHDNNPNIHLKTVKMMGGALTAFSIISADDDKLIEQLKQDNTGETSLSQCLSNNLALAISQLISKTNKDKIINLYLNYLKKTQQITKETTRKELKKNKAIREKWQALQHQWEDEFNILFAEQVELEKLLKWVADNFFIIQITGFDNSDISFEEYGITDSIFLVVFMEILVNALKYMDINANKPLKIELFKDKKYYKLSCENPSLQETARGTHKGIDFLKTIAQKLNGEFINESTENSFKTTFSIPSELLD